MNLNLVNKRTQEPVYSLSLETGVVTILDDVLRQNMQESGVSIPMQDQDNPDSPFYQREAVKYQETDFHDAFYKFYYPQLSYDEFEWRTQ